MKNKILITILIIVILIILIVVFGLQRKEIGEVKIGALLSLSGDAAYFGDGELKAIQLAIEEENQKGGINGRKIKLVVEDMGTLNEVSAITSLKKLVSIDKVSIIIGPTWDLPGVASVAEEEKVILISPDNTEGVETGQNLDYFFSTWYSQRAEMKALAKFAEKENYDRIIIVRDGHIYSETVANQFIESAKGKDITIVDTFIVMTGSKDFRTELLKIKNLGANAILFTTSDEVSRGLLMKQIKELGLNIVVLGTSAVENKDFLKNYGSHAENSVFYAYPKTREEQLQFLEKFKIKYGADPSGPAAPNAYDATKIAITAIRQGAETANEIKEILNTQEFPSITFGKLKFDDKGFVSLESADIIIKTVKNGQFVKYEE